MSCTAPLGLQVIAKKKQLCNESSATPHHSAVRLVQNFTPGCSTRLEKTICCAGGLCGAISLKFWRSGQCAKIFPRCYAAYLQGRNVTHKVDM